MAMHKLTVDHGHVDMLIDGEASSVELPNDRLFRVGDCLTLVELSAPLPGAANPEYTGWVVFCYVDMLCDESYYGAPITQGCVLLKVTVYGCGCSPQLAMGNTDGWL